MLLLFLSGCAFLASLFSTDVPVSASCVANDTVVIDGRDLCAEYEATGKVKCDVGYTVVLDGVQVCP